MLGKIKKVVEKLLDAIAEQNKATYGNERMNCCDLKKSNHTDHKVK